eukprot:10269155-Lingulodinium_polyedra.AAC.1
MAEAHAARVHPVRRRGPGAPLQRRRPLQLQQPPACAVGGQGLDGRLPHAARPALPSRPLRCCG